MRGIAPVEVKCETSTGLETLRRESTTIPLEEGDQWGGATVQTRTRQKIESDLTPSQRGIAPMKCEPSTDLETVRSQSRMIFVLARKEIQSE